NIYTMSVVVEELNLGNDAEVLSREELKKVLGGMGSGGSGGGSGSGIYCSVSYRDSQGIFHSSYGLCGSQDVNECRHYGMNDCRSEAYMSGGTCLVVICN